MTGPDDDDVAKPRPRGIYLLPNLFTTAALFAAYYAIVAAMKGQFGQAAIAIFVAMVMDGLDGRVARLTNTQSNFGVQYDSLSDVVAFGVAPSLVMFQWALEGLGKLGWLGAFLYTACAALRLARFNAQVGTADKRYFQGLASPAAAAVLAGLVWVCHEYDIAGEDLRTVALILTVVAGLLMVSNIRYHSFKDLNLRGKVPFVAVVAVALGYVVVVFEPALVLFLMAFAYAGSGPAMTLVALHRRRAERRVAEGGKDPD